MLLYKYMSMARRQRGFALPTMVLASVLVLMALSVALSVISGTRSALDEQYYAQLAREAAEAGWAKAKTCIEANNGVATWSSSSPLTPQSDCTGYTSVNCSTTPSQCYVLLNGNVRTTFSVGAATTGQYSAVLYSVLATLQLTQTSSPNTVWRTTTATFNYSSSNTAAPMLSGGAGYDGTSGNATNDMGLFWTADNQLYGFGINSGGQLTDSRTPADAATPVKMALPTGVTKVIKVKTSGFGATFLCIIGNDNNVWCRGGYTTSNDALGVETGYWIKMSLPAGLTATSISVSGYGGDNVCAIAGSSTTPAQAYCAGDDGWGRLGNGNSSMPNVPLVPSGGATVPPFILPAGLSAVSVEIQDRDACVIASDNNLYCAGLSGTGQIAGTVNGNVYTPVKYVIPAAGSVARKVQKVLMQYHSSQGGNIFVLTTDGVIWFSGDLGIIPPGASSCTSTTCQSESGTGINTGSTGTNPAWVWGNSPSSYTATGGTINASTATGQCLDVIGSNFSSGTNLDIYGCNGTDAQRWFWTADTGALWLPFSASSTAGTTGSSTCVDLPGNTIANGTKLRIYTCNGSAAQQWVVESDSTIRLKENTGYCIDRPGGATANGTQPQLYTCNGTSSQTWNVNTRVYPWKGMISMPYTFCGLRYDPGTSGVWCSGDNTYGEFANYSTMPNAGSNGGLCTSSTSPINMNIYQNGTVKVDYNKLDSNWEYQYNSLLIIGTDGQVYGAGRNVYGKLGNGGVGTSSNNYAICYTAEFTLPAGVTAVDLSTRDEYTTYVLGSDGNVYAAGANNVGQLGNGTVDSLTHPNPSQVLIPTRQFVY